MKKFNVIYIGKNICDNPYIMISVGSEEATSIANWLRVEAENDVFNHDYDSALLELTAAHELLESAIEMEKELESDE